MRNLWIIILLLFSCNSFITGQTLNVVGVNGSQEMYDLDEIGKLHFAAGVLMIDQVNGNTDTFPLEDIGQLNFTDATGAVENNDLNSPSMLLFPNPVNDRLTVKYTGYEAQHQHLDIYNSTGQLVKSVFLQPGLYESTIQVDLSGFAPGLYVCHVSLGSQITISKFIKK
jgi:hypothetical protein